LGKAHVGGALLLLQPQIIFQPERLLLIKTDPHLTGLLVRSAAGIKIGSRREKADQARLYRSW
jgi:hypothetical protein